MTTYNRKLFRILSLDGGGSKGAYSLGVLAGVEELVGPLHKCFDLIYGTSTGAIIGSLIALGESVGQIWKLYDENIPKIMGHRTRTGRSRSIRALAEAAFKDKKFGAFQTTVGIVATYRDTPRPAIFKTSIDQAHIQKTGFEPGFGCTIADAVVASCAAFPFFEPTEVDMGVRGVNSLLDGGFVANNPTTFAVTDAVHALNRQQKEIRVLSVGVGHYPQRSELALLRMAKRWWPLAALLETTFEANSNTVEQLGRLVFTDVDKVRVDESFTDEKYATNLLDSDRYKLSTIRTLGRNSFGAKEKEIRELLL